MNTQTYTETLVVVRCGHPECDLTFGMPRAFYDARREDHRTWWCPNGHPRAYLGQSEEDRLRSRLRVAEQSEAFYRQQAATARRSAAAQKGQRTRVLNLIARGVCPVAGCRRNFTNVREHMATKHPDFHGHEEVAL